MIMDEMIDDVKAMFVKDGVDITNILEIEQRYANDMRSIIDVVEGTYERHRHLSAKELAAMYKNSSYFGLIMAKYNGKVPQYLQYFEKNMLTHNYGLNTLRDQLQKPEGAEEE